MAIGNTTHSVREYGAVGDGVTDDTAAFQAAIDSLPISGGVLEVPRGDYLIDPIKSVRLRSHMQVVLKPDARLLARPNAAPRAYVLTAAGIEDVEIVGGEIVGDRVAHTYTAGSTHEWGHGISCQNVQDVTIRDMKIRDCTGDGISVGGDKGSKNVTVVNVRSTNNRRQGLTVGRVVGMRVLDCTFAQTNGTNPAAGIDIEPDSPGLAEDILIEGCAIVSNRIGVSIYTGIPTDTTVTPAVVRKVVIRNCQIIDNNSGIYAIRCGGIEIVDNVIKDQSGSGVRLAAGVSDTYIEGNHFANNYNRDAVVPVDRVDFQQFGATKTIERDIYITSEGTNNHVGRNWYE